MKEEIVNLVEVATASISDLENYLFNNLKEKYIMSKHILDDHKEHVENIRALLNQEFTNEELDLAKSDLNFIIETIKNGKNGLSYENTYGILENEQVSKENEQIIQENDTPLQEEVAPSDDDSTLEFNDAEIDELLNSLNDNVFETVFPKEDIKIDALKDTIADFENEILTHEDNVEPIVDQIEPPTINPVPGFSFESSTEEVVEPVLPIQNEVSEAVPTDYSNDLDINALDNFLNSEIMTSANSENMDSEDAFRL